MEPNPMKRLLGLLILVRAFAPILAIAVLLWGGSRILGGLQQAVAKPVAAIQAEVEILNTNLETTFTALDDTAKALKPVVEALQDFELPTVLPTLPDSITFPGINLPNTRTVSVPTVEVLWTDAEYEEEEQVSCGFDPICHANNVLGFFIRLVTRSFSYPYGLDFGTTNFSISLPNVPSFSIPTPAFIVSLKDDLNAMLAPFIDLYASIQTTFAGVRDLSLTLQTLPDSLSGIRTHSTALADGLQQVVLQWGGLLTGVFIFIVGLVAVSYAMTFISEFWRGLRLFLFGT
jgi:hypothetical protein